MVTNAPFPVLTELQAAISFDQMRTELCSAVGNEFGVELDTVTEYTPPQHDNAVEDIVNAIQSYMSHWLFNALGKYSDDIVLKPTKLHEDIEMIAQGLLELKENKISLPGEPDRYVDVLIDPNETQAHIEQRVGNALHGAIQLMMESPKIDGRIKEKTQDRQR